MESFDWGTERPGVLNPKFADADGNGVVNVRDLNLLRWYFKYTHNSPESRALECEGNPILKFVKNGNTRMEKTYVSFLEKRSIERYNFSVLNSNSDDVILINSLAKTWKDTSVFIFEHHSYEQQISLEKIEVVYFQNSKRDIPIIDTFQQLFYILKAKSTGVVEICDFTLFYANGTTEKLLGESFKIGELGTTDSEDGFGFSIYPSPTHSRIIIDGELEKILYFELYDSSGRQLLKEKLKDRFVNLTEIGPGIHILKFYLKNGKYFTQKIIID